MADVVTRRWIVPATVAFLWFAGGSNYLAVHVVASALPPLFVAAVRLVGSTILMVPLVLWRLHVGVRPTARQIGSAAVMGMLLLAVGQTLLTVGVSRLSAGTAAVLGSSAPLFVALIAWALLREPLGHRRLAGIGIGFVGLTLMSVGAGAQGSIDAPGALAVLLFAAAWAAGSLYGTRADLPEDTIVTLFVQLLVASVPVTIVAASAGDLHLSLLAGLEPRIRLGLCFTILVGSIMTFGVFNWVNRSVSSTVANSMAYAAPVVALALGFLWLGEKVTPLSMAAATVTLAGVALMVGGTSSQRHWSKSVAASPAVGPLRTWVEKGSPELRHVAEHRRPV